jgi:hypothetical protein
MASRRSACQICFDEPTAIAGNAALGGGLCRRGCRARVCVFCLAQHVQVALADCFAGILPRILCPACCEPMGLDRWRLPLEGYYTTARQARKLREQYDTLCKQACWMMPACCYQEDYTHLPEAPRYYRQLGNPLGLPPAKMITYRRLMEQFCEHRVEPGDVVSFAVDTFGASNAHALVERTLEHIADSERRARLMLSYLYRFPNTHTRCCNQAMCFNCKRKEHHRQCAEFDKPADEATCLVRCRNCRVLLMKVEGCDTVYCVCGFFMYWSKELARKNPLEVVEDAGTAARDRDAASVTSASSVTSLMALWEADDD